MNITRILIIIIIVLFAGMTYIVTATTPPAESGLIAPAGQIAHCTPDEAFEDVLSFDIMQSLTIVNHEDETLWWGLLAPDTPVRIDATPNGAMICHAPVRIPVENTDLSDASGVGVCPPVSARRYNGVAS